VVRFVLVALLLLVLAWAFWRLMDGVIAALGGTTKQRASRRATPAVKLVRDPVCGTWVQPGEAVSLATQGSTHYFCSTRCREDFAGR
jgi:YHS domain-containing protein